MKYTNRSRLGAEVMWGQWAGGGLVRSTAFLCLFALLSGCVVVEITQEREREPVPQTKPQPVQKTKSSPTQTAGPKPAPDADKGKPSLATKPEPALPAKPEPALQPQAALKPTGAQVLPRVAVLISNDVPAYTRVANELAASLKQRAKIYRLSGEPTASSTVVKQVQSSSRRQVVAIGLLAARAARQLTGKQVIFCQVFNYQDYHLVTPWMKGVSMVPQLSGLFNVWKALDPGLQQVGVITGRNHEPIVNQARRAAQPYGIRIIHRVVSSDKEMLHAFKQLAPDIQGLWLLPDNRVLSPQVIRTIMSYSVKQGKQVSVLHPQLLKIGGLISVKTRDADVAAHVLARLQQAQGQPNIPGPDVVPPSRVQLQINSVMAKRLGLVIPQQYRQLTYEP
ncbi:MAG: ABC transporter substrate binding protein [Acidiferrobacterales bacterium]